VTTITTRIIKIGNSQGIRIPKVLLEQLGFPKQVTLEMTQDGALVVRPGRAPREGWQEAFQELAAQGEDALLSESVLATSSFDAGEVTG